MCVCGLGDLAQWQSKRKALGSVPSSKKKKKKKRNVCMCEYTPCGGGAMESRGIGPLELSSQVPQLPLTDARNLLSPCSVATCSCH